MIESFDRESSLKSDEEAKEIPTYWSKKSKWSDKNPEIDSDSESDLSDLLEKNEDNMI